jgi:hypothetical protein
VSVEITLLRQVLHGIAQRQKIEISMSSRGVRVDLQMDNEVVWVLSPTESNTAYTIELRVLIYSHPHFKEIIMTYTDVIQTNPGKRTCKYYKACGNAENCKRCQSYEKEKK